MAAIPPILPAFTGDSCLLGRILLSRTVPEVAECSVGNTIDWFRSGASRLFQLSRILDVPISFFFEDMPAGLRTAEGQVAMGLRERDQKTLEPDPLARRETLELVRAYYRISNPRVRKRLFELTKSLANATGGK